MIIVALTGYARSGKDEASRGLHSLGFQRIALADPIKEHLIRLDPIVGQDEDHHPVRYSEAIDWFDGDADAARNQFPEMRRLQQRYGTEVHRSENPLFWVKLAQKKMSDLHGKYVITDCRFSNEAESLNPTAVIRIVRPGVGPVNGHPSDQGLPEEWVTGTVVNDSTVDVLHARMREMVSRYL